MTGLVILITGVWNEPHPTPLSMTGGDISYVVVDEAQDANPQQMRLVQQLVGPRGNVTFVGDDDQAIYAFRGADIRNILDYGGGALMDIGCYSIHLSRMLMGSEPTAIKASVRRDPATGVDIYTAGVLEFGERVATFACSTRVEDDQRVDIYGSRGRICN